MRQVLLSKLSGSSSFCSKASEERWKAKHTGSRSDKSDLAEALADAELIHAVNASFENDSAAASISLTCLNCGHSFSGTVETDDLGPHSSCPECGSSFDVATESEAAGNE